MDRVNGRLWLKELCKRTNRTQHFHYAFFERTSCMMQSPRKQVDFKTVHSDAFNKF